MTTMKSAFSKCTNIPCSSPLPKATNVSCKACPILFPYHFELLLHKYHPSQNPCLKRKNVSLTRDTPSQRSKSKWADSPPPLSQAASAPTPSITAWPASPVYHTK